MSFHNILDRITAGYLEFDSEWRYIHVNTAAVQMLGRKPGDLLGRSFWEAYPEFIGTITDIELHRAVSEQVDVRFELLCPVLHRWVEMHAIPTDRGLSIFIHDITEHKQAQEEVQRLNRDLLRRITELQTLLNVAPVGIAVADDPECRRIRLNPAGAAMLGIAPTDNASKSATEDLKLPFRLSQNGTELPPERLPMQYAAAHNVQLRGVEVDVLHDDGRLVNLFEYASPLLDEQGHVRGCLGVFVDITERKSAENDRLRLLEREQQARADAERANRLKDEFLAVVSHEIRTPLNAITGWCHLLKMGNLDSNGIANAVETITRNAYAQVRLIDDILDVSRIITGKFELQKSLLLLMPIVRAAVDSVSPTAESRNIHIHLRSSATSATAIGEAGRLQQVLSNVIFNAVKFSKDDDVVDVSVDQNGPFTRIVVSDNGQGISPEFLPYVFERFRQADGSTTRRHGGLGLGLAIARHILQLHDGTISVHSDGPGRGTRVTIELPIVARLDAPGAIQTLSEPSTKSRPAGPSRLLSGMQILAVDDHEETLDLLAALLEQEAAIVRRCRSASEALNALEDFDADVLIADIAMPREDGCMLLQRMRNERGKLMPAIAVTACVRREDRARILEAGFDLYLPKPIDPAILIRSLFQISRRHAASSET